MVLLNGYITEAWILIFGTLVISFACVSCLCRSIFCLRRGQAIIVKNSKTGSFIEVVRGPRTYFLSPWNQTANCDLGTRRSQVVPLGKIKLDICAIRVPDKHGVTMTFDFSGTHILITDVKKAIYDNAKHERIKGQVASIIHKLFIKAANELAFDDFKQDGDRLFPGFFDPAFAEFNKTYGVRISAVYHVVDGGKRQRTKVQFAQAIEEYKTMRGSGMSAEDILALSAVIKARREGGSFAAMTSVKVDG